MKKLLILILIALVLALTIFTIVNGVNLGGLTILGIKGIQYENEKLEQKVEEATRLVTVTYPKKTSEINSNIQELEEAKKQYEDIATVSTTDEVTAAAQISNYKIETLWTTIGIHAKKAGVTINIAVINGTGGQNTYNLNFTVNGAYINISEFIRSIEDDSTLGFKIEEFSLKPGTSDNDLQATFVCKNIIILDLSQTTNEPTTENESNVDNTTNTTNTTNSTNTTNTTNTANTSNMTNTNTNNTAR